LRPPNANGVTAPRKSGSRWSADEGDAVSLFGPPNDPTKAPRATLLGEEQDESFRQPFVMIERDAGTTV